MRGFFGWLTRKWWYRAFPVRSITLRRDGDDAIVEVESMGRTVEVIREFADGSFCHNVSSGGIRASFYPDIDDAVQHE